MRVQKRKAWLTGLAAVLAAIALTGGQAGADVASDKAGSVIIFPKVIADGTRDTLISLTNTWNSTAFVHCEYRQGLGTCLLNGAPCSTDTDCIGQGFCQGPLPRCLSNGRRCRTVDDCPSGDICGGVDDLRCRTANFDLVLTRQQPTIWRVSTGRVLDLTADPDGSCDPDPDGSLQQVCPGFFFSLCDPENPDPDTCDPLNPSGRVLPPPGSPSFQGELRCFQFAQDMEGMNPQDAIKGEAIIETLDSPQISKYNSINIEGGTDSGDLVLKLNNVEYNACPTELEFTNHAVGAGDPVVNSLLPAADCAVTGCPVRTEITVVPCSSDYEHEEGVPETAALNFEFFDEFEALRASRGVELQCWANLDLDDLTDFAPNGTTYLKTRVTSQGTGRCRAGSDPSCTGPNGSCKGNVCASDADCGAGGACGPVSGILAVVEEFFQTDASEEGSAPEGSAAANVYMVGTRQGRCRDTLATCTSDSTCTGKCRDDGSACTSDAGCGGSICDGCLFDEIILNDVSTD